KLQPNVDTRGIFTEVFQKHWNAMETPRQWSIVTSTSNVLRGCHLHLRHDEYFFLIQGEVSLGLRDERLDSPTRGHWQLYRLFGTNPAALTFPAGLVHGWYFHTDSLHLQAVSESYLTYGDDDNWGIHWADPELEIPWPFDNPLLSERAASFQSLIDVRQKLTPSSDLS
ncbi:MAG: dTDP-4-dehydrorhamnose 3,5-epimerase family protein, partial [Gammaproteobacteria bacterium]|nr:dTDP-4-dehydrorhamnose 3,5-epimerase family protein [Gammaproteobacteria bacterium]